MRDILVLMIALGSIPIILIRPHVGILMWSWLGYMSPHRLTYGYAYDFPFAALIGAVTLLALVVSKEPKRVPWNSLTLIWVLFLLWINFTTLFALYPDDAAVKWEKIMKIQLMTLITLMLMGSRERLHALVWVIVISLGFYGVKGGIFVIYTGGESMVYGPEGSFITGNNELAFALTMILPLMRYLQLNTANKWVRYALVFAMLFSALAILGSYSRGAFLAIAAIAVFLWLKSRRKFGVVAVLIIAAPIMFMMMPDKWVERMGTIKTYEQDSSAMGRIYVWTLAVKIANDNPMTGGGLEAFGRRDLHQQYALEITGDENTYIAMDAHSIYFLILGEHGYVGLILFLALWVTAFRTGSWIVSRTNHRNDLIWARDLAAMIQVGLIGFAVAGAFVGQPYFDLYYHLIAILILVKAGVKKSLQGEPEAAVREVPEMRLGFNRFHQTRKSE